jgi:molybdate transport repressor ModE-like protein
MVNNQPWQSNGAKQVLAKVGEHPLWKGRKEWAASGGKDGRGLRGTGFALGGWLGGLQPTSATVRLNPDGSLNVLTGQVDIAGTNISLAQIAASAFGVDFDQVKITTGDTDTAPLTGLSAGSKTIYTVGTAVLQAAQDARRQTFEIAAKEMEASVHDLEIRDGKVIVKGAPDKSVTLASIGKKGNLYMSKVPPVLGTATPAFSQQAPGFAAQIARVEVDPDTGETTLHDFVVIQDVGKAINPLGVEGQMQGGAVQSLGIAMTEGLMFDDAGRLMNPSLLDYRKLTAADLPNIETIIVEVPRRRPFGARGGAAHSAGTRRHRQRRRGRGGGAHHGAAGDPGAHRAGPGRQGQRGREAAVGWDRVVMRPKLKVWVTFGDRLKFGDGRAQLLQLIDEFGSLRKAATELGMSYRNAWGYLRELEEAAGFTFLERVPGGGPRSGMRLTDDAKRFLKRYRQFRDALEGDMKRRFARSYPQQPTTSS